MQLTSYYARFYAPCKFVSPAVLGYDIFWTRCLTACASSFSYAFYYAAIGAKS
jgi:hypothetical protein